MPVDVLTEIVIERLCETVASYAANPDNAPAWYVNCRSSRLRFGPSTLFERIAPAVMSHRRHHRSLIAAFGVVHGHNS